MNKHYYELEVANFEGQNLDHCFYVDNLDYSKGYDIKRISFESIFKWIKESAIKEGLTIELKSDKIIFITKSDGHKT